MNFIKAESFRISKKKIFYFVFVSLLLLALFYCKTVEADSAQDIIKASLTYGTAIIPILFIPVFLQVWQADFNSRFINNVLVSGMSRVSYYLGKLIMMYLLAGIMTFVYSFGVLVFACFFNGKFLLSEFLPVIAVQLFLYLVVMTIGLTIYIVVDSAALSTAVYLLFILLFENLASALMKQIQLDVEKISPYMIMQNLSKAVSVMDLPKKELYPMITSGAVLWMIAIGISILLLKEREYK